MSLSFIDISKSTSSMESLSTDLASASLDKLIHIYMNAQKAKCEKSIFFHRGLGNLHFRLLAPNKSPQTF